MRMGEGVVLPGARTGAVPPPSNHTGSALPRSPHRPEQKQNRNGIIYHIEKYPCNGLRHIPKIRVVRLVVCGYFFCSRNKKFIIYSSGGQQVSYLYRFNFKGTVSREFRPMLLYIIRKLFERRSACTCTWLLHSAKVYIFLRDESTIHLYYQRHV